MLWLYCLSLLFLLLANYAHYKTSMFVGTQVPPGTAAGTIYSLGGHLPPFAITGLLGWGFYIFSWWVPLASVVGGSILAGWIYGKVPIGATFVIFGLPVGVALAVLAIFAAS